MIKNNSIICGDCLDKLKELSDNSVDSIVTDPPYHLTSIVKRFGKDNSAPAKFGTDGVFARASKGFMGKTWDGGDIAYNVDMWKECLRVLKPGGHLLSFSGTRTYHRMAVAIEDAGFEIRDMIEWIYGSGFPKSLNIGKAVDKMEGNEREVVGKITQPGSTNSRVAMGNGWQKKPDLTKGTSEYEGWGTALKPSHEPICFARKPLSEKTVVENVLKHGTGGLNIDESRVGSNEKIQVNVDYKEDNQADGWGTKKCVTEEQQAKRFPANLIHDNSEEVRECFPKTSKGSAKPRNRNTIGSFGMPNDATPEYSDSGNASRFFKSIIYQAKASKSERNAGCDGLEEKEKVFNGQSNKSSSNMKDVEKRFTTQPKQNNHPTVKPIALMEYLIKMITPKGGTVLDMFMGSGSTGCACVKNGFDFIGIDMTPEYIEIAKARIKYYQNEQSSKLF